MSGCATQPSTTPAPCAVTPETVTATQSQAEAGEAASQYQVGLWYQYAGGCLKPDKTKATEWFRRAAEQGHADAQWELGHMYYYGYGIEEDGEESARWYQKAAEQGHSRAAWRLGDLYARGRGVSRDADRAEYWYRRAFAGNALSQTDLDYLLVNLDKIRDPAAWERKQQRLAEERKQELKRFAEKRVQEQQRLAEAGDREAQYQLGILYSGRSVYVERDLTLAAEWFQKSADQGYAEAQFSLGLMHEAGIGGIPKDDQNAKDLYQKAADQEHYLANQQLCALSENCTPAPIYTPASRSTGRSASGGSEYWILLCLIPYVQLVCVLGGGM